MLFEGLVGVMALIAAAALHPGDYFAINVLAGQVRDARACRRSTCSTCRRQVGENVIGRTGGAVSLAVGMAEIFASIPGMRGLMDYWYHFAIMFEALFILTTDRLGHARRPLPAAGVDRPRLAEVRATPTGCRARSISSAIMVLLWGYFIWTGSIDTIWPLFGVANQLLASVALAVGTTMLINMGRAKYAWVTVRPAVLPVGDDADRRLHEHSRQLLAAHQFTDSGAADSGLRRRHLRRHHAGAAR